jgi:hypothetical protein
MGYEGYLGSYGTNEECRTLPNLRAQCLGLDGRGVLGIEPTVSDVHCIDAQGCCHSHEAATLGLIRHPKPHRRGRPASARSLGDGSSQRESTDRLAPLTPASLLCPEQHTAGPLEKGVTRHARTRKSRCLSHAARCAMPAVCAKCRHNKRGLLLRRACLGSLREIPGAGDTASGSRCAAWGRRPGEG